jgi:dihydrodipicolinate synthase/N-acetylneuraminate lyase
MLFKMKGVVPPMITPFTKDGQVDYKSLKILVNFLRDKVDGIFITGSYGSGAMMSLEERKEVTEIAVKTAGGQIPVIAMVGTTNNRETVELAKHAEAAGVAAIAAVGPYYFIHNDDSICYFFEDLVKSVKNIPVYVYNNPKFQGYPMSLNLLKRLKMLGVSGIKDATFDILAHATYHRVLKDENFDVVLGTEAMWLSARTLGTEAFIPGLANAFPEICQKMYREGMIGDYEACRQTQFAVNKMRDIMYLAKSTQLAIYAMLEVRGVLKSYSRAPFIPATDAEKQAIREELLKMEAL